MARKPSRQQADKLRQYTKTSQEAFNTIQANSGAPNIDTSSIRQADNLRNALGSLSGSLNRVQAAQQAEKDRLDLKRADFFAAEFLKDRELGLYSKAQIGEIYPDKSPIVLASITEAVGNRWAKEWTQTQIDIINNNPALINDTASRQAALDSIRDKLATEVGDRSFFGAGAVAGMNGKLNEWESRWAQDAANYHTSVQVESLYDKVNEVFVANTITQTSPEGTTTTTIDVPKALLELDKVFGETSSLDNFERREVITSAVIAHAIDNRDMGALNAVQGVLLGGKEKVRIADARNTVLRLMESDYNRSVKLEERERLLLVRKEKDSVWQSIVKGEDFDVKTLTTTEGVNYFYSMRDTDTIKPEISVTNRENLEEDLVESMITGDWTKWGFEEGYKPTSDEMREVLQNNNTMNSGDITKLVEGVENFITASSIASSTQSMLRIKNLTAKMEFELRNATQLGKLLGEKGGLIGNPVGDIEDAYKQSLAIKAKEYIATYGIDKFRENRDKIETEALKDANETYLRIKEILEATEGTQFNMAEVGSIVRADDGNLYRYTGGDMNNYNNLIPATAEEIAWAEQREKEIREQEQRINQSQQTQTNLQNIEQEAQNVEQSLENLEIDNSEPTEIISPSGEVVGEVDTSSREELKELKENALREKHLNYDLPENFKRKWLEEAFDFDKGEFDFNKMSHGGSNASVINWYIHEVKKHKESTGQDMSATKLQELILDDLNLTDNPYFNYTGIFDFADEQGEKAIKKLVKQVQDRANK